MNLKIFGMKKTSLPSALHRNDDMKRRSFLNRTAVQNSRQRTTVGIYSFNLYSQMYRLDLLKSYWLVNQIRSFVNTISLVERNCSDHGIKCQLNPL